VPHLPTLQQAAWQERKLYIKYLSVLGRRVDPLEELVDPYGLVAKEGAWYLVCAKEDRMLVIRLSRMLEAKVLEEPFTRPADFNLVGFWEGWWAENQGRRPYYPVKVRASPQLLPHLAGHFGERIKTAKAEAGPPDEEGWVTLTLPFEYLEEARERILGFGGAMEVLEPYALRRSIMDFAEQIVNFYGTKDGNG
jgi:predicted DNA-binding transcriptional regulator YafY